MPLTPYQLEQRKNHIGASECAAVLGVSPYQTAYDLWMIKTQRVPGFAGNEASELGNMIENGLLDWVAADRNDLITKNQYRVHAGGILSATHDALSRKDSKIGYEAKTTGIMTPWNTKEEWGEAGTDEIPAIHIVQCHQQMVVSDLDVVYVPALIGGRGRLLYEVTRNETLCQIILEKVEHFWTHCILADTPPEYSTPSLHLIKMLNRIPDKVATVETDRVKEWLEAKEAENNAKETVREAKAAREQAEAAMLADAWDAEAAECELGTVKINTINVKETTVKPYSYQRLKWLPAA